MESSEEMLSSKRSKELMYRYIMMYSIMQHFSSLSETLDTNCQGCGFVLLPFLVPGLSNVLSLAAVSGLNRICPVAFSSFIWQLLVRFSGLPFHLFLYFLSINRWTFYQ